jgi:hypothetical protein
MANEFTYQVIKDTTEQCVIKLTGKFDGSGQEDNAVRIQANTLYGALNANTIPGLLVNGGSALSYYGLTINRIWYSTWTTGGEVTLYWQDNVNTPIFHISGGGEYDGAGNWITVHNPNVVSASASGNIGVKTRGAGANSSYTIVLEIRKDNAQYQRGQFNDPAAFNYPPYNMRP